MNESFVTVVGNVVSDPISRPTKVGRPFASLRIASTTRRWDAEKRAFVDGSTNFLNVVAFNALAANVMTSVKKGHPVVVYGRAARQPVGDGEGRAAHQCRDRRLHDRARPHPRPGRVQPPAAGPARHQRPARRPGDPGHVPRRGRGGRRRSDESGMREARRARPTRAWSCEGGFGQSGFGRRVEDADTDDYVVVNGG